MLGSLNKILRAKASEAESRAASARAEAAAASAKASAEQARSAALAGGLAAAGAAVRRGMVGMVDYAGGYQSAKTDRLTNRGMGTPDGSPNYFLNPSDRRDMRGRCRDLKRNNPTARALLQAHQDALVGDGGVVAAMTRSEAWNDEADRLFAAWAENEDPETLGPAEVTGESTFWDRLAGAVMSWGTHGDELLVHVTDPESGRLTTQWIPGALVVNPGGPATLDGGGWIGGVRLSPFGRPVEYCVSSWEEKLGGAGYVSNKTTKIPADRARLLVNPRLRETGAVRGEPGLQGVADRILLLDDFVRKNNIAATVATLFGLLIKTEDPSSLQEMMEEGTGDQTETDPTKPRDIEMGPAFVKFLRPGESVEQVAPNFPTTNFREFVLMNMLVIGADMGMPLPWWVYEAQNLTASNLRSLLGLAWRRFARQQDYLIRRAVSWTYKAKIKDFIEGSLLDDNDEWDRHEVALPLPPVVDFKTEAEGINFAVRNNLMTHDMGTRMLGTGKAREIMKRRGEEKKIEIQEGVVPAELPGVVAGKASAEKTNAEKTNAEPAQPDSAEDAEERGEGKEDAPPA